MFIGLTQKLATYAKIDVITSAPLDPLFSWHANLIMVNGKKSIIALHDRTRVPMLFYNVKVKDMKNLNALILDGIKTVFSALGINQSLVNQYLSESGPCEFVKTSSRSILSSMSLMTDYAQNLDFYLYEDQLLQVSFSKELSEMMFKVDHPYDIVLERFYQVFANYAKVDSLKAIRSADSIKAYQLLIKIKKEEGVVWRRVVVPANINFEQFHNVIQSAFGWLKYNEYAFIVFHKGEIVSLITDEGIHHPKDPNANYFHLIDYKTPLKEYVELFEEMEYIYDYILDWRHQIILEKIIPDYYENYPTCLSGYGTTPEDETLLTDLQNNPKMELTRWDSYLLENRDEFRKFDIKDINYRLRSSLHFSHHHWF